MQNDKRFTQLFGERREGARHNQAATRGASERDRRNFRDHRLQRLVVYHPSLQLAIGCLRFRVG